MKYAIIRLSGHQYKVIEGEELLVDFLNGEKPEVEVLMVKNEDKIQVGSPVLTKNPVTVKVIAEEEKGIKLHVSKFKAKSRYRKKVGFRPTLTRLKIEKIG